MKNTHFFFKAFTLALFLCSVATLSAQEPPPPPSGGGHAQQGNQPPGGGSPVGSGIVLFIALAIGYGGKKVYDIRRKLAE